MQCKCEFLNSSADKFEKREVAVRVKFKSLYINLKSHTVQKLTTENPGS